MRVQQRIAFARNVSWCIRLPIRTLQRKSCQLEEWNANVWNKHCVGADCGCCGDGSSISEIAPGPCVSNNCRTNKNIFVCCGCPGASRQSKKGPERRAGRGRRADSLSRPLRDEPRV